MNNPAYDFSVDRENKTITVKREYAAPRSLVWDAYTKSELLDRWWAPKPWQAKTKTMDFREGGHWLYVMTGSEGDEHWSFADYIDVQPQERFTGRDGFSDAEGNINTDMPQSSWEISFSDSEEGTLVSFRIMYDDLQQLEATIQMGFKEGLSMAMEGLDKLLIDLKK
jgi:uncharacterized protein YndB with AHSA1/START domain